LPKIAENAGESQEILIRATEARHRTSSMNFMMHKIQFDLARDRVFLE